MSWWVQEFMNVWARIQLSLRKGEVAIRGCLLESHLPEKACSGYSMELTMWSLGPQEGHRHYAPMLTVSPSDDAKPPVTLYRTGVELLAPMGGMASLDPIGGPRRS